MPAKRALIGAVAVLGTILACGTPTNQVSPEDLPGTITAQALTLQAPTATAAAPTATVTSGVKVSVTSDTNCRTGPSQNFDRVLVATPGQIFTVVGKNTPTNYWIIQTPTGGTCWLWGRYAVTTGDPSTLPEYPAPPEPTAAATHTPSASKTPKVTATPYLPAAPSGLSGARTCQAYIEAGLPKWRENAFVTWVDNADNELGFGVHQNDLLIAFLPENSTGYQAEFTYNQGTGGQLFDKFEVRAFNNVGASSGPAVDVARCP